MSIRNPRTRRHEDDLWEEARRNGGTVPLASLLAHAEEIIVETPEAYGVTTSAVVQQLVQLVRYAAREAGPEIVDLEQGEIPLNI